MKITTHKIVILACIVFMAGTGLGLFLSRAGVSRGSIFRENGYSYISPIISCEIASDKKDFNEFREMEKSVENVVVDTKKEKSTESISVYFRALNSGRWFGINENETYSPASLLKLATVIAYYKAAESDPSLLSSKFVWDKTKDTNEIQIIVPGKQLEDGVTYSAEDLIVRTLVYSDNNAATLLKSKLDVHNLGEVYSDLNLPLPNSKTLDFMSPKSYSALFRTLYSATYVSRSASERILEILTQSEFHDGLQKDVPGNIMLSHKFGERMIISPEDRKTIIGQELHDCGIIYYPEHPYFLCVMTRGDDADALKEVISIVSKKVYEEMDNFWKTSGK